MERRYDGAAAPRLRIGQRKRPPGLLDKASDVLCRTLKALFNLKAIALTGGLSVSSALALPFMEAARQGPPPGGAATLSPNTFSDTSPRTFPRASSGAPVTAPVDFTRLPPVAADVMTIMPDGTALIDGFVGCALSLPGRSGDNTLGGPRTLIIHAHGQGAGKYFSLTPDSDATAKFNGLELDRILTVLNPETLIIFSCNPQGATPESLDYRIHRADGDRRLKTVIMAEPDTVMIFFRDIPLMTSYDDPLGRTLFGYSNDRGYMFALMRTMEEFLTGTDRAGGFVRYERTDGAWVNKGAYKGDNLFNLMDPLPLGWLCDTYSTIARGQAVYDELHEINDPANSLTYWDKVSRNLAKPVASTSLALSMGVSAAAERVLKLIP